MAFGSIHFIFVTLCSSTHAPYIQCTRRVLHDWGIFLSEMRISITSTSVCWTACNATRRYRRRVCWKEFKWIILIITHVSESPNCRTDSMESAPAIWLNYICVITVEKKNVLHLLWRKWCENRDHACIISQNVYEIYTLINYECGKEIGSRRWNSNNNQGDVFCGGCFLECLRAKVIGFRWSVAKTLEKRGHPSH